MWTDTRSSCGAWNLGIPDLAGLVDGFQNIREGGVNLDFLRSKLDWNVRRYGPEMQQEMENRLEKKWEDYYNFVPDEYNDYKPEPEPVDKQARSSIPSYVELEPNTLYYMSDRAPHCSLPVKNDCVRTFFRLVVGKVGVRWTDDCTPNDLVQLSPSMILKRTKF